MTLSCIGIHLSVSGFPWKCINSLVAFSASSGSFVHITHSSSPMSYISLPSSSNMNIHSPRAPLMAYSLQKKQKGGGATCTGRYLGRFVILGIYASVAVFLWHAFVPTRSEPGGSFRRKLLRAKRYLASTVLSNELGTRRPATKNVVIYAATQFFGHPITTERFLATCPDVQVSCYYQLDHITYLLLELLPHYSR